MTWRRRFGASRRRCARDCIDQWLERSGIELDGNTGSGQRLQHARLDHRAPCGRHDLELDTGAALNGADIDAHEQATTRHLLLDINQEVGTAAICDPQPERHAGIVTESARRA